MLWKGGKSSSETASPCKILQSENKKWVVESGNCWGTEVLLAKQARAGPQVEVPSYSFGNCESLLISPLLFLICREVSCQRNTSRLKTLLFHRALRQFVNKWVSTFNGFFPVQTGNPFMVNLSLVTFISPQETLQSVYKLCKGPQTTGWKPQDMLRKNFFFSHSCTC